MITPRVTVTITGPTTLKRTQLALQIDATMNGVYVLKPRTAPQFVVCNDPTSPKASRFIAQGSDLMSEQELLAVIESGSFPATGRRRQPPPELRVDWKTEHDPPLACTLDYFDAEDTYRLLTVSLKKRGVAANGNEYWLVDDAGKLKTLRTDRILSSRFL